MIEKVIRKSALAGMSGAVEDLRYWRGKTPAERVAAVEFLRRQYYGSATRLQRIVNIIQR